MTKSILGQVIVKALISCTSSQMKRESPAALFARSSSCVKGSVSAYLPLPVWTKPSSQRNDF
jgi:hypothetical protein